jgi:Uma2 family endonuclease
VEVAASSVSRDLHQKKDAYARNGVREYLVWRVEDAAIDWFDLIDGRYRSRDLPGPGRLESQVFPGLVLDVPSALRLDAAAVLATLESAR